MKQQFLLAVISIILGCQASLNYSARPGFTSSSNQSPQAQQTPPPTQYLTLAEKQKQANEQLATARQEQMKQAQERQAESQDKQKVGSDQHLLCARADKDMTDSRNGVQTCEKIKELESELDKCSSSTNLRDQFTISGGSNRIKQIRQNALAFWLGQPSTLGGYYEDPAYYEQGDLPDGLPTGADTPEVYAEKLKTANLQEIECLGGQGSVVDFTSKLDRLVATSVDLRTKEAACRKNKKCLTRRENMKGAGICDLIEGIKFTQNMMQEERSNPSGVVNLNTLHEAGEGLQVGRQLLREARADFRKAFKRDFPDSFCKELPKN